MKTALFLICYMFALLQGYWLVVIAIVTWFSYWHPAWWLFFVTVMIDAYLGGFATVPVLSLVVGAFVLFVEALKIHLVGVNNE